MRIEDLQAYEIIERKPICDIGSEGIRLRHKKTGARFALISNNDNNKVFYVGFRTPPADSTGVAHITEHSVLCGSKDFPLKDPFVELVKGSLNTFLNAMTFPDKTVYPVASCNDADFANLMHVYLDAVFYPNSNQNEAIFRQEGWHYEFDENDTLFVNGVVYNEMKGAFSSPEDVLSREVMNSLYPDTSYGVESGGDPDDIPDLTYEQFLDFHKAYYHPSNSYFYLYGDMDMAEKLDYIDKEYLSKFEYRAVDSSIAFQETFAERKNITKYCNLNEGENPSDNTYLSLNYSLGKADDIKTVLAMQVIDYVLTGTPGAPLKQALVDRKVGNDIYSNYDNGIMQPYFSIIAKDTSIDKKDDFLETVNEVLEGIVENGFDKKSLRAAINHFEFMYREADYGNYPKGLIYGLNCLDTWLYNDDLPFSMVELGGIFEFLKTSVDTSYFENIVSEYLLDNTHSSYVELIPQLGLQDKKDEELRNRLAEYKKSLTAVELENIRAELKKLNAFQEQVDSPEALASIPLLKRSDLKREADGYSNIEMKMNDILTLRHDYQTNGISYLSLMFSFDDLPGELYPYMALLKNILEQVDTDKHKYAELNNEIDLVAGYLLFSSSSYNDYDNPDKYKLMFNVKSKYLYGNAEAVFSLMNEMIFESHLNDTDRILEILTECKSQTQAGMVSAGHSIAVERASAGMNATDRISDITKGVSFYHFLSDLIDNYDERKEDMVNKLNETLHCIFRRENMMIDITASEEGTDEVAKYIPSFADRLFTDNVKKEHFVPELLTGNEALTTSGQVLYVCRAGNFRKKGFGYNGALNVLKVIMGYKYLWENVRVKGGAYGCMCNFTRDGMAYFVSYRDPNLSKTIDVYEGAADAISNFDFDERTMTQFIIGTVSNLDVPLNAKAKGNRSLSAYLCNISFDSVQQSRNEVLDATPSDIRALSDYIRAFMDDKRLVVVGNAAKINEEAGLFDRVSNMF